ncbi:MAG: hypothetical protein JNM17_16350 [Archangium sp.]|nr:hypothetical protein [Archangium sp.]
MTRSTFSRCVLTAVTLATAGVIAHGCTRPCGDLGLECCAMEQCLEPLICREGTCETMRRDAGIPATCGVSGLNCCSGVCFGGLQCGPDDRCFLGPDLGKACAKNSECDERLCLPVGTVADAGRNVCTAICTDGGVCPAGWRCAPYPGVAQPICLCASIDEQCNGLDDDCDGVVDGPAAQAWCATSDAGSCTNGACTP